MADMQRARSSLLALPVLGAVVIGWASVNQPLLAMVLSAVLVLGVSAVVNPAKVACGLAFLTAAFPKAGVKVADFPFPVFLLGLTVAVLLLRMQHARTPRSPATYGLLLITLAWIAFRASEFIDDGPGAVAAFLAWSIGPLVILFLVTDLRGMPRHFTRSVEWGFLFSVSYALLQLVTSVEQVAIPGLTFAFGDDLSQKHNVIFLNGTEDITKIPSTYQNGNIYGLVAAVFLVLAARRILELRSSRFDWVISAAAALAIGLSGSRMAIVAAGAALLLLLFLRGSTARKVGIVAGLATTGFVILALQPGLVQRYSISSLAETGGAGRAEKWNAAIASFTNSDWFFGVDRRSPVEGWPGIIMELGLLGIVLLLACYVQLCQQRREYWIVGMVLATGALIDSAYLLFPTLFIPAALMSTRDRHEPDDDTSPAEREDELLQSVR